MKKMLENRGLRVLAFLLCCVLGLLTAGCALGAAYVSYEPGMGADDQRDFASSELAESYALNQAWAVINPAVSIGDVSYVPEMTPEPTPTPASVPDPERYGQADTFSTPMVPGPGDEIRQVRQVEFDSEQLFLPDPASGFSCVVRDPNGEIVADTRVDTSRPVETGTVDAYGFTVETYINLPVGRNTELYGIMTLYDALYNLRRLFLPLGLGAGALTVLLFVFLMAAAGRTSEGVKLGGLHRWPLELYLGALGALAAFFVYLMLEVGHREFMRHMALFTTLYALCTLGAGTCALLGCMTLAARFRAGKWWRNTVTFFCLKWLWRGLRWLGRAVRSVARAIPVGWQAGLTFAAVALLNMVGILCAVESRYNGEVWFFFLLLLDAAGLAAALLVGVQLKKLRAAGRALAAGDLSYTVDTGKLWGSLRAHGEDLNAVGQGMTRAVEERMRSERFKTELITNVSHDLKTPLTSIVNYVDLLKKEDVGNETAREYIEILDRQSQRLRKLTADLMDAAKASSGAMTVNRERVDLAELLRQSAGEYAGRFAAAGVEGVLTLPEGEWTVTADGRLLWRVLDNLLQNVVKYAQSGTRCYLELKKTEAGTELAVKNISREALNIPAEELMERFVRGDAARSSEGSGLGLSIARSLTELMGGALRLTLDGDLFKVTLAFPEK